MDLKKGRHVIVDITKLVEHFNEALEEEIYDIIGLPKFFKKSKRKKALKQLGGLRYDQRKAVELYSQGNPEILGTRENKTRVILALGSDEIEVPIEVIKGTRV